MADNKNDGPKNDRTPSNQNPNPRINNSRDAHRNINETAGDRGSTGDKRSVSRTVPVRPPVDQGGKKGDGS